MVFAEAERLSTQYTVQGGHRGMDVLHVAAALILGECQSPAELSGSLLRAMQAFCEADGYTVNSVGSTQLGLLVSSTNYTRSDMDVFNAHLHEHPLYETMISPAKHQEGQAERWSDHTTLREFQQTALYHDLFRLTDTQHQLAAGLRVNREITLGLSFNRARLDFRPEDARLLEMLRPHIRSAVQRLLAQREVEQTLALQELAIGEAAVMIVDSEGALLSATERARQLARDYFPMAAADGLPLELRAWLRRNPAADERWTRDQPGRRLVCTCGSAVAWPRDALKAFRGGKQPASVRCLRFTEQHQSRTVLALQKLGLTPREAEVLHWMAEGKRNGEIAIILGVSERTVDKHRENLFAKLDVETRTAAVARAWEAIA